MHLMAENRFTRLGASRSAMWCIAQAAQRRRWTDFPTPMEPMMLKPSVHGPDDFARWRRWIALVVGRHHCVQSA